MRVYLPATLPMLRTLLENGSLRPAHAYAVTPSVRKWYAEGDEEELEYAVLRQAAVASLRLLDADPDAAPRRVVIAADVPDGELTARPEVDRPVVALAAAVPLRAVAAVHADTSDAEPAVRAAVAVILESDLGSATAQAVVEDSEGYELAWYATQEIGALLELG